MFTAGKSRFSEERRNMVLYTIDDDQGCTATIAPEKGATVVSLTREGEEYLYRDEQNLRSSERPRCGIPFLFPIFGRLKEGRFSWKGREYPMEIHGFAHTSAWRAEQQRSDRLVLSLEHNAQTWSQYPFAFRMELTFQVREGSLIIHPSLRNQGQEPMPFQYGFHPYFLTPDPESVRVETHANFFMDGQSEQPHPFGQGQGGIVLAEGAGEAGGAFLGVEGPSVVDLGDRKVTISQNGDYPTLILWTQAGKPFLCVEPICGTPNGLNTGDCRMLYPGETWEGEIKFTPERTGGKNT